MRFEMKVNFCLVLLLFVSTSWVGASSWDVSAADAKQSASATTPGVSDQRILSKKKRTKGGHRSAGRSIFLTPQGRLLGKFTVGTNDDVASVNADASSSSASSLTDDSVKPAAVKTLKAILGQYFGATEREVLVPTRDKIYVDKQGNRHIRFKQKVDHLPVEGASLMMHLDKHGSVLVVNGEFSSEANIDRRVKLDCEAAMEVAISMMASIQFPLQSVSKCNNAAVRGEDGNVHLAYKQVFGFQPTGNKNTRKIPPYQRLALFASRLTGELVAKHVLTMGARKISTYDCFESTDDKTCALVSNSTNRITNGDYAIEAAHNFAIDTYDYYYEVFDRDSLDDGGMEIVSNVHWDRLYSGASWTGGEIFYGDGDGNVTYPFSYALDVVAHELTHGVIQYTAGLNYQDESGSLVESICDVFGATIERYWLNKSNKNTWLIGEDLYVFGGALRNMANPSKWSQTDYYPDRYTGSDDYGGVHINSGIGNLAFVLMVQGGKHPKGKTKNKVKAIKSDFNSSMAIASSIYYAAVVACLTESSDYAALRACTVLFSDVYSDSVEGAWDAVGVDSSGIGVIVLRDDVFLDKQSDISDSLKDYSLEGVKIGETVTCLATGGTGDADMYVKFASLPDPFITQSNSCQSWKPNSNEEICTTGIAMSDTDVFMSLYAFDDYKDVTVMCVRSQTGTLLNNAPVYHISGSKGSYKYYALGGINFMDTVTCSLTEGAKGSGDAELHVKFVSLPFVSADTVDCESTNQGNNEECTATFDYPLYEFSDLTVNAFVAVFGESAYRDVTLICKTGRKATTIQSGTKVKEISNSRGGIADFKMADVKAGSAVTCTLAGRNGDADLYVRFGDAADPHHWSLVNDCESISPNSNEQCQTWPTLVDTTVYVAIDAFTSYDELSLVCTSEKVCKATDEMCTTRDECCSTRSTELTCDGPGKSSRVCTVCMVAGARCTRNSQCCSGLTCKGKKENNKKCQV